MKKIYLLLILIFICGCNRISFKPVNKEEALKLIKNKDAVLIDVRSNVEYESGHIENAVSFPVTTILDDILNSYDKNTYIIVYCKSGNRSKIAAEGLVELGYKHVYDLGSINKWK